MLRLFNSLTKTKEPFKSIVPKHINMYVCGVTVYDHCHLGHARCMVVFDMMANYFCHLGYELKFVRNITDVDDKIIKKALEQHVDFDVISTRFTESMHEDAKSLGIKPPTIEPKATEHIQDMIDMIQILIDKEAAYVASNGDVCFAVEKFSDYGKLSRQNIEQLMTGIRIDINEGKRSPLDFVLWKQAKAGEPSWPSPWGDGRPGWHIECSAMAKHHLGAHIDIHGGGLDLQFPHHENEIAQSEACNSKTFANYWLHVGLLQINNEKMAKSTGNFLTIKDALKLYHPEVIKLFFMTSHYRSPLNLSEDALIQSHKTLQRLYQTIKLYGLDDAANLNNEWISKFESSMNDDFNTSEALAILFDLNTQINKEAKPELIKTLVYLGNMLGILKTDANAFLTFSASSKGLSDDEIEGLIQQRKEARVNRDFKKADEIRSLLQDQGIELEDSGTGTSWRRLV